MTSFAASRELLFRSAVLARLPPLVREEIERRERALTEDRAYYNEVVRVEQRREADGHPPLVTEPERESMRRFIDWQTRDLDALRSGNWEYNG